MSRADRRFLLSNALFLKMLYPRRLYAEHFVFALHFHAVLFLAAAVALVSESLTVLTALVFGILLYIFLALKQAYRQSWTFTTFKYAAILYAAILALYWATFTFAITSVVFLVVLTT